MTGSCKGPTRPKPYREPYGFIALTSVLIISAVLLGLVTGAAERGLYARADALDAETFAAADAAADGCIALASLARAEGAAPAPLYAALGSSSCAVRAGSAGAYIATGSSSASLRSFGFSLDADGALTSKIPLFTAPP